MTNLVCRKHRLSSQPPLLSYLRPQLSDSLYSCPNVDDAIGKVRAFMSKNPDASTEGIVNVVTSTHESVKVLFSRERIRIFVKAVFDNSSRVGVLAKFADVLIRLTESDSSLEHYLIAVLEEVCSNDHKMFPLVLIQLYDEDVFSEETILEWSCGEMQSGDGLVSRGVRAALRASAEPMISWLQCESSEDKD